MLLINLPQPPKQVGALTSAERGYIVTVCGAVECSRKFNCTDADRKNFMRDAFLRVNLDTHTPLIGWHSIVSYISSSTSSDLLSRCQKSLLSYCMISTTWLHNALDITLYMTANDVAVIPSTFLTQLTAVLDRTVKPFMGHCRYMFLLHKMCEYAATQVYQGYLAYVLSNDYLATICVTGRP